ncbi:hypothetical protein EHYA_07607 [Embleya hyalina]|uniref:Uncharacterized protein n=1 Tax=Embleya hyalina TaxID=516124 RepID=A0A401YZF3_9ACTN|nr:hypothetical protein EHYA_07607 [Embleya hyalina]
MAKPRRSGGCAARGCLWGPECSITFESEGTAWTENRCSECRREVNRYGSTGIPGVSPEGRSVRIYVIKVEEWGTGNGVDVEMA